MKKLTAMFAAMTLAVVAAPNTASALGSWSFVMLGDTRDGNSTYTGINSNLNAMAQMIASLSPQLVIVAGDLCNGNCLDSGSRWYPTNGDFSSQAMKKVYAQFFTNWQTAMQPIFNYTTRTGTPIYTVRGNHESNDTGQAPIEVLKEAYKEAFGDYVPNNGPTNWPNTSLTNNQRGFSWSLTTNNVTFVAADQYFNFDPSCSNTTPWSGYHSLDQAWVTQQLHQSTSPYKILVSHEPIVQAMGNGPSLEEQENENAQHFFGTNAFAIQTRSNFWNDIGDAGAQIYLCGHLHIEVIASTTNNHGHTIIQLLAGNGGAPPQEYVYHPEPGVTPLYENGNVLITSNGPPYVQGFFGFALATVQDDKMTIHYYSLNPSNNVWTVADYVTEIASPTARPVIRMPFDPLTGTFSYTRTDPAGANLSYQVYTSPDLKAWSVDAAATQTITAITNNIQTVQVILSGAKPLTAAKLFVRVVAQ